MNIIELVGKLKTIEEAEKLMISELPGIDYGSIDTFMVGKVDLNAEVAFFDGDNIPHGNIIEINGITYQNFFPFAMLQDMIQSYNELENRFSDEEVARRILDYWKNDA
jgi:hypothetical protein